MATGQAEVDLKKADAGHKNALTMKTVAEARNAVHQPVAEMFKAGALAGQQVIQNQADHAQLKQEQTAAGLQHMREILALQDRNKSVSAG